MNKKILSIAMLSLFVGNINFSLEAVRLKSTNMLEPIQSIISKKAADSFKKYDESMINANARYMAKQAKNTFFQSMKNNIGKRITKVNNFLKKSPTKRTAAAGLVALPFASVIGGYSLLAHNDDKNKVSNKPQVEDSKVSFINNVPGGKYTATAVGLTAVAAVGYYTWKKFLSGEKQEVKTSYYGDRDRG